MVEVRAFIVFAVVLVMGLLALLLWVSEEPPVPTTTSKDQSRFPGCELFPYPCVERRS